MTQGTPGPWLLGSAPWCGRWARSLAQAGIAAYPVPLTDVVPPPDLEAVEHATATRGEAFVLLTSVFALDAVAKDALTGARALCVGASTATCAQAAGLDPVLVGYAGAEALAAALASRTDLLREARDVGFLWLRGREHLEATRDAFASLAVEVREVETYVMQPVAAWWEVLDGMPPPPAVVVGSPRALTEGMRAGHLPDVPLVVLGRRSADRARALGLAPVHVLSEPTPDALASRWKEFL